MRLVSDVLRTHGGLARWNRWETFSAHVALGGALVPPLDGAPRLREFTVEGETRRPRLKLFSSFSTGRYGIYRPDMVEIRTMAGERLERLERPAAALAARPAGHRLERLERLFLFGNAVWSAVNGPFLLRDAEVWENESCLEMRLSEELDPLCPHRLLHVGEDGLLRRADYAIRHIHPAPLADRLSAYLTFDGIRVATLRRARAIGTDDTPTPAALLDMEIFDLRFY